MGADTVLEEDIYNGENGHAAKHNAANAQVNFLTEEWAGRATDSELLASIDDRTLSFRPGVSAAANRTLLLAALNDPANAGAKVQLLGDFPVTGGVMTITQAVDVDARGATFTQQDNQTPIIQLPSGTTWRGGVFVGKGSDFVDNTSNVAAAAIKLASGATDVTIIGAKGSGLAGAGVQASGVVHNLKLLFCEFDGVGTAGGIVPSTSKDGGGISLGGVGNSDVTVFGGHYKGFPQGMTAGDVEGLFIGGGVEFEAAGQHGIYCESVSGGVVNGVRITAAVLEGIKYQISSSHGVGFTISNVVMESVGSHGLHLTNAEITPTHFHKMGAVSNLVVISPSGSGDALLLEYCDGVSVSNVRASGNRRGVRVMNSLNVTVDGLHAAGYTQVGIYVAGSQKVTFSNFTLRDGSTGGPGGTDPHSVLINDPAGAGSTSSDLTFSDGELRAGTGAPVNHLYIASGDTTTMRFANLFGDGASAWGSRFASAGLKVRQWTNVDVMGTTARFNNAPLQSRTTDPNGWLGKSFDPALAGLAQPVMTAGTVYTARCYLPDGGPITSIVYEVQTQAGATLTASQCFVGVYDEAGNLLGVSADQSVAWTTTGVKTTALVTPTAIQPARSFVDVAWVWNGTTSPRFRGFNGSGAGNMGISASAENRFATADTGRTTLPATLGTKTAAAAHLVVVGVK